MQLKEFTIMGLLGAASAAMSKLGLAVPLGFEILHLISGVGGVAGYVIGRTQFHSLNPVPLVLLVIGGSLVCIVSCVSYYILIEYMSPGIRATIVLSCFGYLMFFGASFVLALAERAAQQK